MITTPQPRQHQPTIGSSLSLVLCTRNRPDQLARSLPSLLANLDDLFELIVVDQSDTHDSELLVTQHASDKVTYVRSNAVGQTIARNLGLSRASADLIAYTDDDCLLPPDWARGIMEHFQSPSIGAFFGSVVADDFDYHQGFIPEVPITVSRTISGCNPCSVPIIMGANMAFRRDALVSIGGFDQVLGPGAPLKMFDDIDAAYRVLRSGYQIVVSPSPEVVHFGFRDYESGAARSAVRDVSIGAGAYYAKHLRSGDVRVVPAFLRALQQDLALVGRNIARRQRPLGVGRPLFMLLGAAQSLRFGIDGQTRRYRRRHETDAADHSHRLTA